MSGTKKEHVKIILQTIENGTLSETEMQRVNGLDIYVADNEGQTTAYWYNKNMYICLSGSASETEIINAILYMIGE